MTVKLAVLKSGEDIIADIKELVNDEGKTVSLIFSNPYVVKLISPQMLMEHEQERQYSVSFIPWIPLSEDKNIAVKLDWIVTVVEPTKMLKESYEERMNGNGTTDPSVDLNEQYIPDIES
jgi:hypothetical protein